MNQTRYKCGNCASISEAKTEHCTTCGMKGMLAEVQTTQTEKQATVKKLFVACRNCGTTETGNGSTCIKCHFPIAKKPQTKTTKTTKIKTS